MSRTAVARTAVVQTALVSVMCACAVVVGRPAGDVPGDVQGALAALGNDPWD